MMEERVKLLVCWRIDSGVERIRTDRTVRNSESAWIIRRVLRALCHGISGLATAVEQLACGAGFV